MHLSPFSPTWKNVFALTNSTVVQSLSLSSRLNISVEADEVKRLRATAVSSEAWAKLRDWAGVAGRGRLLLSGSVAHVSLETPVQGEEGS